MKKILVCMITFAFFPAVASAGPLHNAARDGDISQVKALIAEGEDANKRNRLLGWPLHQAALNDYVEIAEMLIASGADVNVEHRIFGTPLHVAARKGNFSVVALLLEHGADPDAHFFDGSTPLHFAASEGRPAIIELLVVNGADILATTARPDTRFSGYTALHSAGREGHFDIVTLLQSLQAGDTRDQTISTILAAANAEAGQVLFEKRLGNVSCSGCHLLSEDNTRKLNGPNLHGIVGRPKASIVDFEYSDAFEALVRLP